MAYGGNGNGMPMIMPMIMPAPIMPAPIVPVVMPAPIMPVVMPAPMPAAVVGIGGAAQIAADNAQLNAPGGNQIDPGILAPGGGPAYLNRQPGESQGAWLNRVMAIAPPPPF